MLFSLISVPLVYAGDHGALPKGTEDDPFLIDSVSTFLEFLDAADNQSGEKVYFALVNDIDAWIDLGYIGGYIANNISFDGNGHKLKGFKFSDSLFESLTECNVRNVIFDNVTVSPKSDSFEVAVLANSADGSSFITNCTFRNCTIRLPSGATEVNAATVVVNNGASIANTVIEDTTVFEQSTEGVSSEITYNIGGVVANNTGYGYIVNTITAPTANLKDGPAYNFAGAAVFSETNIAYCYSKVTCPENVQTFDTHVIDATGQYAKEDFWITREGDLFKVRGGESKDYSSMSLMEFSAELSELSMKNYNQSFSDYLSPWDYAVLWSVDNDDLCFSYDGKTGSVYIYVNDDPLKDATITFEDTVYTEEITKNGKYAVRVGVYGENNAYTRNTFEISVYTKDFTMVENFVYRPNQTYVKSLPNKMDGEEYMTYSDMYLNSHNNGADSSIPEDILDTGIINRASGNVYPFCTTISLSNISGCDEVVDYRFHGNGTDAAPFLINNFYEIECLANHVKKGKLYFGTERYNRANYKVTGVIRYPENRKVIHSPIGTYSSDFSTAFSGTFDGGYFPVYNVTVSGSNSYAGFFGVVAGIENAYDHTYANIKRVTLRSIRVEETNPTLPGDLKGCLAGQISHTVVNGCWVDSDSEIFGGTQIGGIVGYSYNSELYNCASLANITTYHPNVWSGGIVGYAQYSKVVNGYAKCSFSTNNIPDITTTAVGSIAGAIKKSDFDNVYYQLDNGLDDSVVIDGVNGIYYVEMTDKGFVSELTAYSEKNGLDVYWVHDNDKSNNEGYPYLSYDPDKGEYSISCVPTSAGKVEVYTNGYGASSMEKAGSVKAGYEIYVPKASGLLDICLTGLDKSVLNVEVVECVVSGVEYFMFIMPARSVRVVPDFGTNALVGIGTEEEPYIISSYNDLVMMSEFINTWDAPVEGFVDYPSAHYVLINDIDCEGQTLNSIGNSSLGFSGVKFNGTLDGQGYTIKNLKVTSSTGKAALFGYVQDCTIKNITFDNYQVDGSSSAAFLVCYNYGHLKVMNTKIVNSALSSGGWTAQVSLSNYLRLTVINCIFENNTINGPSAAYILWNNDEYVHFEMRNVLFINMDSGLKTIGQFWSTSKVFDNSNVYYCNTQALDIDTMFGENVEEAKLYDAEFISDRTDVTRTTLKAHGCCAWGARVSDGRADLEMFDSVKVISKITYDSIFSDGSFEFIDVESSPKFGVEGDVINVKYNLRGSTANIKAEVGNKTTKIVFDETDGGDGMGTMHFIMPGENVNITNNDEPLAVRNLEGKGTEGEPYEIHSGADLKLFADFINGIKACNYPDESYVEYHKAYVKLMSDIDMTGVEWQGIGTATAEFKGIFDGDYHTISYLNIANNTVNGTSFGLFNVIGEGAEVKEVTLYDAKVYPSQSSMLGAGIIAKQNKGRIAYVTVDSGSVTAEKGGYLGGIAGINCEVGIIEYCAVRKTYITRTGEGADSSSMGGITEENNGTVNGCYTYGCTFGTGYSKGAIIEKGNDPRLCVYYTNSTVSSKYGTAFTVLEFASGKATYRMNEGGTTATSAVWRQTLGDDLYPVLDRGHKIVYLTFNGFNYTNIKPGIYASSPTIMRGSVMVGDVNCDGDITEADSQQLESFMNGETTLDYFSIIACDVNGDGVVDKADYDAIIAYLKNNEGSGESLIGTLRSLIGEIPEGMVALGDLNRDGVVDHADLEILEKYISGELVLTDEQKAAANTALRDVIDGIDRDALAEFLENLLDLSGYTGNVGRFVYLNAPKDEEIPSDNKDSDNKVALLEKKEEKREEKKEESKVEKKEDKKEEKDPSNPVTGDSFNYILYLSTLTFSIIGVVLTIKSKKKKETL